MHMKGIPMKIRNIIAVACTTAILTLGLAGPAFADEAPPEEVAVTETTLVEEAPAAEAPPAEPEPAPQPVAEPVAEEASAEPEAEPTIEELAETFDATAFKVKDDEDPEVPQTCKDLIDDTWEEKVDTVGDPATVPYTAPEGFLVDMYCVKAGNENSGGGAQIILVDPPAAEIVIDHPDVGSVSHWSVHLIPIECPPKDTPVNPGEPSSSDVCGTENDSFEVPGATEGMTFQVDDQRVDGVGNVVITGIAETGYVVEEPGEGDTYELQEGSAVWTLVFTDEECPREDIPVNPGEPSSSDVCGTDDDAFSVPAATEGMSFLVDDQRVDGVGDVVIYGLPDKGYVVEEPGEGDTYTVDQEGSAVWILTFTDEACPVDNPPTLALTGTSADGPLQLLAALILVGTFLTVVGYARRRVDGRNIQQ